MLIPCLGVFLLHGTAHAERHDHDVVVYGGTSAGVIAAVKAARLGKSVVLIEPTMHVGGMTSSGLGATDTGNKGAIGGLSRDFYARLKKYYDDDAHWRQQKKAEYAGYRGRDEAIWAPCAKTRSDKKWQRRPLKNVLTECKRLR